MFTSEEKALTYIERLSKDHYGNTMIQLVERQGAYYVQFAQNGVAPDERLVVKYRNGEVINDH